jgi:hypothetical protein
VVGFAGVKQSLGTVTSGLAVAFETTFLALVLSAIVNLFSNTMQKKEEDLLSDIEEFTTDNIVNKYTTLKDRMGSADIAPEGIFSGLATGEETKNIIRELKNLNKQQKVNTDELLAQLGRLIEAIDKKPPPSDSKPLDAGDTGDLGAVLNELNETIKRQSEFFKQLEGVSQLIEINMEVMKSLPATLEELRETSRKLGQLFAKIYNRTFV